MARRAFVAAIVVAVQCAAFAVTVREEVMPVRENRDRWTFRSSKALAYGNGGVQFPLWKNRRSVDVYPDNKIPHAPRLPGARAFVVRTDVAPEGGRADLFVVTNRTTVYITNLELGRTYRWRVRQFGTGDSAEASFTTEDEPPRLLRAGGVSNFRDLGGWRTADGRRVRENMILRSAGLRASSKTSGGFLRRKVEMGERRVTDEGVDTTEHSVGQVCNPCDGFHPPGKRLAALGGNRRNRLRRLAQLSREALQTGNRADHTRSHQRSYSRRRQKTAARHRHADCADRASDRVLDDLQLMRAVPPALRYVNVGIP